MIIDVVCTVCEHEVEIAEFVTEECPNCGCKIEYDEYCIEDFSDCWVSVYFIKPKE